MKEAKATIDYRTLNQPLSEKDVSFICDLASSTMSLFQSVWTVSSNTLVQQQSKKKMPWN